MGLTTAALLALLAALTGGEIFGGTVSNAVNDIGNAFKASDDPISLVNNLEVLTTVGEHPTGITREDVTHAADNGLLAKDVVAERNHNADAVASNPFWNSLTDAEREAILDEYYNGDYSLLLNDLNELDSFSDAYPIYSDFLNPDTIWDTATSEVEAENAALLELLSSDKATALDLLGSTRDDTLQLLADTRDTALADIASESAANRAMLNSQLQRMGASFDDARDALLTAQYQRNAQTMGTLAADMQSSRRNAIEAGASAGIRIAGNVNALLSAQNRMAQQSLDTSNQLAQMLVNQRNAEAGVAGQWMQGEASRGQQRRAADSAYTSGVAGANDAYNTGVLGANSAYTSEYNNITSNTFNNISNRANAYTTKAQNKYDVATGSWSDKFDSAISATNPLRGHYETYLKKPKY